MPDAVARLRHVTGALAAGAAGPDGEWLATVLRRMLDDGQSLDVAAGLPVRWRDADRREQRNLALRRAAALMDCPSLSRAARLIAREAAAARSRDAASPARKAVAEALRHGPMPGQRRLIAILGDRAI